MGSECSEGCKDYKEKESNGAPLFGIYAENLSVTIKFYDNRIERDESNFVENVEMLCGCEVGEEI